MFKNASILILFFIISILISHSFSMASLNDFPESQHHYIPLEDIGFGLQYDTPSLHHTFQAVLTFDDGPHIKNTSLVLDTLKKEHIRAAFFVLGENIHSDTIPLIERMYKEGHIVGIHGFDHTDVNTLSSKQFKDQFRRTYLLLNSIQKKINLFQKEVYYRFPGGNYGMNPKYHHLEALKQLSDELFRENCINFVFWNIESNDWLPSLKPQEILSNLLAYFKGGQVRSFNLTPQQTMIPAMKRISSPPQGGVILLHDIHQKTAFSLSHFIKYLKQNGIHFIPLPSVKEYSFKGKTCQYRP